MNKLLNNITSNKNFKRWLGIILAIALVATMFPYMSAAYGNNDEPVQQDEPVLIESGDNTIISEEGVEEEIPEQDEMTDPQPNDNGIAVVAEEQTDADTNQTPSKVTGRASIYDNNAGKLTEDLGKGNVGTKDNPVSIEFTNESTSKNPTVVIPSETTLYGTIYVGKGVSLTLQGDGTINGCGKGSVIVVEGVGAKLILNNDKIVDSRGEGIKRGDGLTITGGTGKQILNGKTSYGYPNYRAGGGIQVVRDHEVKDPYKATEATYVKDRGGSLEMYNGTITGNSANTGGGIFIDRYCDFVMHDGIVDNNSTVENTTAEGEWENAHEGGGIFIAGDGNTSGENAGFAWIKAGDITNNHCNTQRDWGGGGIFVESRAKVKIGSALITKNTAEGLGGGLSGCPHASMGIGSVEEGLAIYGNNASKNQLTKLNGVLRRLDVNVDVLNSDNTTVGKQILPMGDYLAYDTDSANFTVDKAKDFYCTKASIVVGQSGYTTKNGVAWTGRVAFPTESKRQSYDVTIEQGEAFAVSGASLGLTADVPVNAVTGRDVIITGNTSKTHGGGIGCNGNVSIGTLPSETRESHMWSVPFKKAYMQGSNNVIDQEAETFNFALFDAETHEKVADAQNVKGAVVFNVNNEAYKGSPEGKTYEFYAKEIVPENKNEFIEYDSKAHPVSVKVVQNTNAAIVNSVTVITTTSEAKEITYGKGELGQTFTNKVQVKKIYNDAFPNWDININKKYLNGNGDNIFEKPDAEANEAKKRQFNFTLYGTDDASAVEDPANDATLRTLATVNSDDNGKARFTFVDASVTGTARIVSGDGRVDVSGYKELIKNRITEDNGSAQLVFYVKENAGKESDIDYDATWHEVEVNINKRQEIQNSNQDNNSLKPIETITDVYYLDSVSIDKQENVDVATFTNQFIPEGVLELPVLKSFYGVSANKTFEFGLKRLVEPEHSGAFVPKTLNSFTEPNANNQDVNNQVVNVEYGENGGVQKGTNFELVYKPAENENGTHANPQSVVKDYWYKIAETQGVNANDSTVYVVKVNVQIAEDGMSYVPTVKEIYWAVDGNETSQLEKLWTSEDKDQNGAAVARPDIEFFNNDDQVLSAMSVGGFAVYAASGEPVTEKCLVDPKIIKELKGYQTEQGEQSARSMKPGEFKFSLIQVATPSEVGEDGQYHPDWNDVSGAVISTTSNDQYGMVDFDKAAPVEGTEDDPCCLLFTQPGTYFYRVIEDKQVNSDPSVDYSDAIITFTAVVEKVDGVLKTTDMYYGHVENGENVRYTESENPQWHPTMTNYARGMDLQVRKTSALDRENGLEGATYGLYAVNNGAQADIFLGEGTSNEDGWITFKNVSLNEGTLYYFKERLAPAGHTVSEFRSSYFYIVKDPSAPNGYTMMYTDSKADLGSKADANDIVALAEAQDGQDGTQGGTPQGAQSEDGNMLFTFEQDGGVFDEATYTEIAKVDTRTHEWVEGAELSIVEKDSGKVINSWKSGTAVEVLQGKLNVDTTYILREDKAPEGYAKANDVEFKIDQYGAIEILSGTSNGNAELQDATIRLYDTMLDAEVVETVQKENVIETPDNSAGGLSKTGDYLPIAGVALLALGSLIVLLVIARKKRNSKEQ